MNRNTITFCPPVVAYYFKHPMVSFTQEGDQIKATVSLLSAFPQTARVADVVFQNRMEDGEPLTKSKIVQQLLIEGHVPCLRNRSLRDREIIFLPPSSEPSQRRQSFDTSEAIDYCTQAINCLRLRIAEEDDSQPDLICPITLCLFQDPVVDDHGHTYERSAIEQYLESPASGGLCLYRQGVSSLTPNFGLKSIVDNIRNGPIIPLLPVMVGGTTREDRVKADRLIKSALELANQLDAKKPERESAIEILKTAFLYSKSFEDFAHLPPLYEALSQPLKAALAYLYLAKYQLEQNAADRAEQSLRKALELTPNEEKSQAALGTLLMATGKLDNACDYFQRLARSKQVTTDLGRSEAIQYWECALACKPQDLDLYEEIALYCTDATRVVLFTTGYLQFLNTNSNAANRFYKRALGLEPNNPLIHLAKLSHLGFDKPESLPSLRTVAGIFAGRGDIPTSLQYLQIAARSNDPQDLKKYITFLMETDNQQDVFEIYLKWISREPTNETIVGEAIQTLGRRAPFLEQLLTIYTQRADPALDPLIQELGTHYEREENWPQAERIYRLAHARIQNFESDFKVTSIIAYNSPADAVRRFFVLSTEAFNREELVKVMRCADALKQLTLQGILTPVEQQQLFTQSMIAKMFTQLQTANANLSATQEELRSVRAEFQRTVTMLRRDLDETAAYVAKQRASEAREAAIARDAELAAQRKEELETLLKNATPTHSMRAEALMFCNDSLRQFDIAFTELGHGRNGQTMRAADEIFTAKIADTNLLHVAMNRELNRLKDAYTDIKSEIENWQKEDKETRNQCAPIRNHFLDLNNGKNKTSVNCAFNEIMFIVDARLKALKD